MLRLGLVSTRTWARPLGAAVRMQPVRFSTSKAKATRAQLLADYQRANGLLSEELSNEFRKYQEEKRRFHNATVTYYLLLTILLFLTLAYALVPLYKMICQRTGWGGVPITDQLRFTPDKFVPVDMGKKIRVLFTLQTLEILPWKFVPQQREVYLVPGETALAFYKAKNTSDKDIIGMATYLVTPDHVAPYFNKIQCFCFEEQMLRAGEEVDMPVFFFLDPDYATDPGLRNVDDVVLHYTFFKANYKDGLLVPSEEAA